MQAIHTKYRAPTATMAAHMTATCAALKRPMVVAHPIELDGEDAHRYAAEALARRLGWVGRNYGRLHGGGMPDGSFVWIMMDPLATQAARTLRGLAQRVNTYYAKETAVQSLASQADHVAALLLGD